VKKCPDAESKSVRKIKGREKRPGTTSGGSKGGKGDLLSSVTRGERRPETRISGGALEVVFAAKGAVGKKKRKDPLRSPLVEKGGGRQRNSYLARDDLREVSRGG